jgi:hypothetical protein
VRVAKPGDSMVPVQLPATLAGLAGTGTVGSGTCGVGDGEIELPQPNARTAAPIQVAHLVSRIGDRTASRQRERTTASTL